MRVAHLFFRAWVDQVSHEVVHGTPSVGEVKVVVSELGQMVADADGDSSAAATATPPLLEPLPDIMPSPPVPPPLAYILHSQPARGPLPASLETPPEPTPPAQLQDQQAAVLRATSSHLVPAGSCPKGMAVEAGSFTFQGAWLSLGPWRLGENAPSGKHYLGVHRVWQCVKQQLSAYLAAGPAGKARSVSLGPHT